MFLRKDREEELVLIIYFEGKKKELWIFLLEALKYISSSIRRMSI